jgi:hypothetical protein
MQNFLTVFVMFTFGAVLCAHADTPSLGLGISQLAYREPSIGVAHKAWLPILHGRWAPDGLQYAQWPVAFEGQVASGHGDYAGTGTMSHQPIHLFEFRVNSSQTQWVEGYQLNPGLGYRQFYNDARGYTSTGEQGYRRTSEYWYAGLAAEQTASAGWRWGGQFRYLLVGWQTTQLGDISGAIGELGTVQNVQRRGYGLGLSMCKTIDGLDVCPSIDYWRVSDSNTVTRRLNGSTYLLTEPANSTTTFQLLIHHKF